MTGFCRRLPPPPQPQYHLARFLVFHLVKDSISKERALVALLCMGSRHVTVIVFHCDCSSQGGWTVIVTAPPLLRRCHRLSLPTTATTSTTTTVTVAHVRGRKRKKELKNAIPNPNVSVFVHVHNPSCRIFVGAVAKTVSTPCVY